MCYGIYSWEQHTCSIPHIRGMNSFPTLIAHLLINDCRLCNIHLHTCMHVGLSVTSAIQEVKFLPSTPTVYALPVEISGTQVWTALHCACRHTHYLISRSCLNRCLQVCNTQEFGSGCNDLHLVAGVFSIPSFAAFLLICCPMMPQNEDTYTHTSP